MFIESFRNKCVHFRASCPRTNWRQTSYEEKARHYLFYNSRACLNQWYYSEEARSRDRKKWKRVLIVVAFQLRLSRYAFIIIRNGRRRVKSLNAPWAYQLPLNFLLFKRTLVPSPVFAPPILSLLRSACLSLRSGHSWHFLPNTRRRYPTNLT